MPRLKTSSLRFAARRRFAVAAIAVAAGVLPLQAGTAHASTPDEELSACITAAVTTMGDDFTLSVDDCVNTYLAELGVDPSTFTFDSATDAVNTAILGTATGTDDADSAAPAGVDG